LTTNLSQPYSSPMLYLVCGGRGAGKTTFCQFVADAARSAGWDVAGILSLARYENDFRAALDAQDLRSGETRLLATRRPERLPGELGWDFEAATLSWGADLLSAACPCDLLVVDELGPLELERGQGWTSAFPALASGGYRVALAVIRPHLLLPAIEKLGDARIIEIETLEESAEKAAAFVKAWNGFAANLPF
jgi:nucleoside-triphosphatase